jgi:hypothetical protein
MKVLVLGILCTVICVTTASAQNAPEPKSAYGKCIKATGGVYNQKDGKWYPQSAQGGIAARECLARKGKK